MKKKIKLYIDKEGYIYCYSITNLLGHRWCKEISAKDFKQLEKADKEFWKWQRKIEKLVERKSCDKCKFRYTCELMPPRTGCIYESENKV